MNEALGQLAALATAFCWAGSALSFSVAGERIGSMVTNIVRLVPAFVFLAVVATVMRGYPVPSDATSHQWIWLAVSGLVGFTFGDLCLFRSFLLIGPRLSSLLMSTAPLFASVIGLLLLGERMSLQQVAGMACTIFGVSFAILDRPKIHSGKVPLTGVLLGLGGALGQAGGIVLSKFGMLDPDSGLSYSAVSATQIRVLAGFVGYVILFTLLRRWSKVASGLRDKRGMAFTTLGAFFGPFLGVTFSLVAVKFALAGVAASIMATTPIVIIPLAIRWRGDRVSWQGVAGAMITVLGVALLSL